jgi:hypothetical protein
VGFGMKLLWVTKAGFLLAWWASEGH